MTARARILLAETDPGRAEGLRQAMLRLGFEVTAAVTTLSDAAESARRQLADLVLLRLDPQAIETAALIRRETGIPTAYLAEQATPEMLRQAQQSDPAGFIRPPFDSSGLAAGLNRVLRSVGLGPAGEGDACDPLRRRLGQLEHELEASHHNEQVLREEVHRLAGLEQELKQSEERFRLIAENIEDVFWMSTPGIGQMLYVSPAYERIWQRSRASLYRDPLSFAEAIHPDDREAVSQLMERHRNGIPYQVDYRIVRGDGSERWIRERGFPVRDAEGTLQAMTGVCTDLTEARRTEDALKESRRRFEQLVQNIEAVFWLTEWPEKRVIYVSPAFRRIWGLEEEAIYSDPMVWARAIVAEDRSRVEQAFLEGVGRGRYDVTFRITRPDGEQRWIHDRGFTVRNEEGEVFRLAGIASDITDRKRTEVALHQSEERLRLVTETISDVFWLTTSDREVLYLSPAFDRIFGISRAQVLDHSSSLDDLVHPEDRPLVLETISNAKELPWEIEYRILRPDGTVRWIRDRGYPASLGERGSLNLIAGVATDVTERKLAEQALARREEEFRALAERSPDVVARFDREYRELYISPAITRYTGLPPQHFIGKRIDQIGFEKNVAAIWTRNLSAVFASGEQRVMEFTLPGPEGEVFFETRLAPEFGQEGEVATVVAVTRDLSDRKRAEAELLRLNRKLARSESRLKEAERIAGLGHWEWDLATGEVRRSEELIRLLGSGSEAVPFGTALSIAHKKDRRRVQAILDQVMASGKPAVYEFRLVRSDGSVRIAEARAEIVRGADGQVECLVGTVLDITERKQAEGALHKAISELAEERDRTNAAQAELARANAMLERLTLQDPLTGIGNRRYLEQFIQREWNRERRHCQDIALIIADIDFFKAYNDHYGHQQGDECLKRVASVLSAKLHRPTDILVRYGGEEFVTVLPETALGGATQVAEGLRRAVAALGIPHDYSVTRPFVTISLGVAAVNASESCFERLLAAADEALYRAKERGRNRVEVAQ